MTDPDPPRRSSLTTDLSPEADRAGCEDYLRGLGAAGDEPLQIAHAALALASFDRPMVGLGRYLDELAALARDTAAAFAGNPPTLAGAIAALVKTVAETHGYEGDTLTYDDLQNANLMRVIDRKRGLPVALGILYLHAGRAQGWEMAGLAFPGHFLVRIETAGERAILDPFNGGRVREATELRELLKAMSGNEAELKPEHYSTVSDREILLRLQNNLKLRLMQGQEPVRALAVIRSMLLFADDGAPLWHEAGLLNAHLGNVKAAIEAFEACLQRATNPTLRHKTASLLQQLKASLN